MSEATKKEWSYLTTHTFRHWQFEATIERKHFAWGDGPVPEEAKQYMRWNGVTAHGVDVEVEVQPSMDIDEFERDWGAPGEIVERDGEFLWDEGTLSGPVPQTREQWEHLGKFMETARKHRITEINVAIHRIVPEPRTATNSNGYPLHGTDMIHDRVGRMQEDITACLTTTIGGDDLCRRWEEGHAKLEQAWHLLQEAEEMYMRLKPRTTQAG